MRSNLIEQGTQLILKGLGCDPKDPNYLETPERVARWYEELFRDEGKSFAVFPEEYNDFILFRGHRMFSLCPHHLLPVEMKVSLAYIPNNKVLGLSKLPRIMQDVNTGPLLQERFTQEVITRINTMTKCQGSACYVEGIHDCARIRGVHTDGRFVTYKLSGLFQTDPDKERRFFDLLRT